MEDFSKPKSENLEYQTLAARPSLPASSWIHSSQALWSKLIEGRWLLLFSMIAFSLVGLILGAIQVPLYRAQTSIEIESPNGHGMLNGVDSSSRESYLQRQIRIIESRSLLERTLAKLTEADRVRLFEAPRFWWSNDSYDQRLETLRRRISARASEQAGIVDITFLAPDAAASAYLLNSLTQELADFDIERAWRASQHDQQWTERQLDVLRRKWEQSEQVLAEYSRSAGVGDQTVAHSDQPAWEASDSELRELKHSYSGLKAQIGEWESLYGPSSPEASKLRSQLRDVGIAIRQRRDVLAKEAEKPASFAQAGSGRPSRLEAVIRLNTLKQEAETNHQIFDSAATRFKEAVVTAASHMGDISVVDPAVADSRPVTPSRLLYGGLGGFTGLLLGIAFVGLRDRFSQTFDDPALLTRYLGLQVLGTIPSARFSPDGGGYHFAPDEPALNLAFGSHAHTSEAYRTIRSSILLKVGQRQEIRRLIFTSAGHSDGKTTVVANLGAALASAQRRVLLVDGDLRNPGLHKVFGADNEHGLADLLSRQIPASPIASREFIRATQIPGLFLLSAGQAGERAPEILSSVHLPTLIRECGKSFDIVLIDSSPILPYADSRSLARASDGVVLIVRAASTDRRSALLARDAISQDGATILGAILSDWDASGSASA